ncbi:MAG: DUF4124 domain-containing protein [Gammaproteobacteria bacterium]
MRYVICLLITFYAPLGAGEILKWTDENGNVFYGDTPPIEAKTERIRVIGAPSNPGRALPRLSEGAPGGSGGNQNASNQQAEDIPDDQAAIACQYARDDLKVISRSSRIRVKAADGSERYMSTEEINARKQQAEDDIARFC